MLSNRRRYFIELLHVILIVSILVVLALKHYEVFRAKAHVMSMVYFFTTARNDSLVYYALHGDFPQSVEQAHLAVLPEDHASYKSYRDWSRMNISIEQGAVSITSKNNYGMLVGKTMTMRPVVQEDDPIGAVHWVCGNKRESGWKVFGVDRTDIEERHIPAVLK